MGLRGEPSRGLRDRLGVEVAGALLLSDDPRERMRGVDRLGTIGDPPAVDALLEILDSGSPASRDPDTRLHAVRMLAPHAEETPVRAFLLRELLGGSSGKASLVRSTAAMALAKRGSQKSLQALAIAIDQRGPASDAARAALEAYPPRTLAPFLLEPAEEISEDEGTKGKPSTDEVDALKRALEARKREVDAVAKKKGRPEKAGPKVDPEATDDDETGDDSGRPAKKKGHERRARTLSVPMIDFFGELGDLRAIPALRTAAARKQVTVKSRAGLALARFGDPSGLADAREWAKGDDARLLAPAVETLVLLGDPGAGPALTKLLATSPTRSAALDLLFGSGKPELFRAVHKDLEKALKDEHGSERGRIVLAMARVSTESVASLLSGPDDTREVAAFALATSPDPAARTALIARLFQAKNDADRRLIVRASIVRAVSLGDPPPALDEQLDRLLLSKNDADRETGALGLVATGTSPDAVFDRVGSTRDKPAPASIVAGAARGALLRGRDLSAFAPFLTSTDAKADASPPTSSRIAAGVALLDPSSAADVSRTTLLRWAEGGGPLAPLAARALGARDDDTVRSRILGLLHGTDPVVRAHTALGLGEDPEPSSVTLLVDSYLTEDDATVRRACIRALSRRKEVQRVRALGWASELDPDDGVRAFAKLALDGQTLRDGGESLGATLSFVHIARADGKDTSMPARFVRADGLAVPVVSSADGVLLLPAPAYGSGALTVSLRASNEEPTAEASPPAPLAASKSSEQAPPSSSPNALPKKPSPLQPSPLKPSPLQPSPLKPSPLKPSPRQP